MKAQSCKAKGRRFQQFIVSDLLALFPHLTADDIRSTSMGAGGEDIQLSAHARLAFPFSIEAKNQERLNVWSAIEQCHANCPNGARPLVLMKRNKSKPYAIIEWETLKSLVKSDAVSKGDAVREAVAELQRLVADI